jgi:hypothetical protein
MMKTGISMIGSSPRGILRQLAMPRAPNIRNIRIVNCHRRTANSVSLTA